MSTPFDLITKDEAKAIQCQIDNNAEEAMNAPLDYILREWNSQKQNIFDTVFDGNCLIKKKFVSFTKTIDQIAVEIDSAWDFMPRGACKFWSNFQNFCSQKRNELYRNLSWECNIDHSGLTEADLIWHQCLRLTHTHTLAANKIDDDFSIDLPKPDGTTRKYHIQKGSKPMRVMRRLLDAFHFAEEEDFKEFCSWHSRMLNDKKIEGELCISIHPLDYITMSENTCDWTSCMSWSDNGCYRAGTVEMMNSPVVIVAYLSASDSLDLDLGWNSIKRHRDYLPWNSKKWRTLIILDESGIYSVKSYPYSHKEMTLCAMEWIASCINSKKFEEVIKFEPYHPFRYKNSSTVLCINPRTYRMYNDFGSTTHYAMLNLAYISKKEEEYSLGNINIDLMYSGASECMSCGALYCPDTHNGVNFDTETSLVCIDCGGGYSDSSYCDICGNSWDADELIWVNEQLVCPDCFDDLCFEDAFYYTYHFNEDGVDLSIIDENGKINKIGICYFYNIKDWVTNPNSKKMKKASKTGEITSLTLNVDELNEEGLNRFKRFVKYETNL